MLCCSVILCAVLHRSIKAWSPRVCTCPKRTWWNFARVVVQARRLSTIIGVILTPLPTAAMKQVSELQADWDVQKAGSVRCWLLRYWVEREVFKKQMRLSCSILVLKLEFIWRHPGLSTCSTLQLKCINPTVTIHLFICKIAIWWYVKQPAVFICHLLQHTPCVCDMLYSNAVIVPAATRAAAVTGGATYAHPPPLPPLQLGPLESEVGR